ncbi:MAG TPA: hypothetical protein VFA71_04750 [Terriglobales bacterium]|nr:hypothetical protein [Terriglobales bacterium]
MRTVARYIFLFMLAALPAWAQESPYFVTYDHHLEEPGNLEIETQSNAGVPRHGEPSYFAPYIELEYGINTRWTSELYLEGQSRSGDSTIFTGWRFENRFRPLAGEHRINPILYFEYENINEASRIQKEIPGQAAEFDVPNSESRHIRAHELETKLILSSDVHDWNISENFIAEKNLSHNEGIEFGYAFGISRPLRTIASAANCHFCRENFIAGAEVFGGVGSTHAFGFQDTAHYLAPALSWQVSDNSSLRFSPAIGLTSKSAAVLLRFGYSYEIRGFKDKLAGLFRSKP